MLCIIITFVKFWENMFIQIINFLKKIGRTLGVSKLIANDRGRPISNISESIIIIQLTMPMISVQSRLINQPKI